jgi:hypothetical protein
MSKQQSIENDVTLEARRAMARILGRLGGLKGGKSRSPAKVAAARRNAQLAGRPRRTEGRLRSRH